MGKVNVRKEALRAILKITEEEAYASLTLRSRLSAWPTEMESQDKALFTNLTYTTIRHLDGIDEAISACSKTPLRKMDPYVRGCLRLGVCQILFMDGIKPYAAVKETVDLVKASKWKHLAGFVNAVLRNVERSRDQFQAVPLPQWIFDHFAKDYGRERADSLLKVMDSKRPLTLRINTLKASLEDVRKRVQGLVPCHPGRILKEALYLEKGLDVSSFAPYQEGWVTTQDESSMLAAMLTGAEPGMEVLDLCAAPGGKSTMMAQMMGDQGRISSRDLYEKRVGLIRQNASRLGCEIIEAKALDGTIPLKEDENRYDVVLVDAPCSGLGVLRSRPDIGLHHTEDTILELLPLQQQLLETARQAVKPGGTLVYSTCTLTKEENDLQVEAFLKEHPDFELEDLKEHPLLKDLSEKEARIEKHLTLWPVEDGHDGFFVAVFHKKEI